MKYLIELNEQDYNFAVNGDRDAMDISTKTRILNSIKRGRPYEEITGDLISRSALKAELNSRPFPQDYSTTLLLGTFNEIIDNAQSVERPNGDLISRKDLIDHWKHRIVTNCSYITSGEILHSIEKAPPVEAYTLEDMQHNYDEGATHEAGKHDKEMQDFKASLLKEIAKQYTEHGEMIPNWLALGHLTGDSNDEIDS